MLSSSELKILACFFLGGLKAEHVPVNLAVSGPACCLPQPDQLAPVIGSGGPAARQAQPQAEARAERGHHPIPAAGCGHRRHFVQVTGKRPLQSWTIPGVTLPAALERRVEANSP